MPVPISENNTVYVDMDFDENGRVLARLAARSASDSLLHFIVGRILKGEQISGAEYAYYESMVREMR